MIKGYYVHIPPHLSDVLAELGDVSADADFETILNAGRTQLFNFQYPISNADRETFEKWFCNHYMTRRVGSGNIKKWRQMLKAKLWDIMPYYKQLFDSEKLEFDPLINNDITTDDTGRATDNTTRDRTLTESGNYTDINRYSDTPQGDSSRIWEIRNGVPVLTDIYLTDVRGITNNSSHTATEHETVDNDKTHSNNNQRVGLSGVGRSQLLTEYRETFLRIYEMLAEELDELFYNLIEVDDIIDYEIF